MTNDNFQEIKFKCPTDNKIIQGLLEIYIADPFLKETADKQIILTCTGEWKGARLVWLQNPIPVFC